MITLKSYSSTHGNNMSLSVLKDSHAFMFQDKRLIEIENKIKANALKLSEIEELNYKFGVTTGVNIAFLLDEEQYKQVVSDGSSGRFIRKCARGRNISKFKLDIKDYIICIEKGYTNANRCDKDPYEYIKEVAPNVIAHLEKMNELHNNRVKARKCGDYWWEHNYNIASGKKLMLSKMSINMSGVVVDDEDVVPLDSVIMMSGLDVEPLCCMVNSTILDTLYKVYTNCSFIANGGTEKYPQHLGQLYIPYREEVNSKLRGCKDVKEIDCILMDAYGITDEDLEYLLKFKR